MGLLDKAKKLAELAKEKADDALAEVRARAESPGGSSPAAPAPPHTASDDRMGTPYIPGMLGKPGWREEGLVDPAAVLPIDDRDKVGIAHSTKSEVREEPFGMGRRWTSGGRAAGLYYRLTPEQRAWLPPGGLVLDPEAGGALVTMLDDGRSLMFLGADAVQVVLEVRGLDVHERAALARAVAEQLSAL
ncbi:MAG TPA: hypothetical protein VHM89_13930 [Acidimicrobiales bacterium]|nr:hypothetical protein [Acidimicrobiales bacterium]